MGRNFTKWETELWSYMSHGDGLSCPDYESCQYRLNGYRCICDNEEFLDEERRFIDKENLDFALFSINSSDEYYGCLTMGKIFKLVIRLADKYRGRIEPFCHQIIADSTNIYCDAIHMEVRRIPLKAHCGAVWQLNDGWVIYLNSNNGSARQRFTLYHEIFHILAHNYATPIFKKPFSSIGSFNELLADHFAAVSIMPRNQIQQKWKVVKNVGQMATIFDVPQPVMYRGLQRLRLL